ncbi:MAG: hypothetical protein EXS51_02735 [Candidatus Taylorbacteria bacterium]|nr:hypothetical protein [Candidatus Taylorbacteria bacterium]
MPYTLGKVLAEGKTKQIIEIEGDETLAVLESKDDITAGDGAKHEVIVGKGELATRTTCNVFQLLVDSGLPVAYRGRIDKTRFLAPLCKMLPYEMVARRESHGSHQHRCPHVPLGTVFPRLKTEVFAKTSGRTWRVQQIPMDDPLLEFAENEVQFFLPHWTKEQKGESARTGFRGYLVGQQPFLRVSKDQFFTLKDEEKLIARMIKLLARAFLVIEKAWQLQGRKAVDIKIEFGIGAPTLEEPDGQLFIADVIDNDSWRVVQDGSYICKQSFRDDGNLNDVTRNYQLVADLTDRFVLPKQRIIIWTGSPADNTDVFTGNLHQILGVKAGVPLPGLQPTVLHVRSFHKEPVAGVMELHRFIQEVPDCVIIDYVGRSNGAGPTISANCTVPTFNVPAGTDQERTRNVWSSLELPSKVPAATIMEPTNAVLAALQVLAVRNACLYSLLRQQQEERFTNVIAC